VIEASGAQGERTCNKYNNTYIQKGCAEGRKNPSGEKELRTYIYTKSG
jgi:hypothetical protein